MLRASSVVLTPRAYSRTRCGVAALEDGAARGFLSARPLGPSLNCVDVEITSTARSTTVLHLCWLFANIRRRRILPSRLDESGRAPLGRRCYGAAWRVRPAVPSLATHPHVKKHITLLGVYWVGGFCWPAFPPQVPLASDVARGFFGRF